MSIIRGTLVCPCATAGGLDNILMFWVRKAIRVHSMNNIFAIRTFLIATCGVRLSTSKEKAKYTRLKGALHR